MRIRAKVKADDPTLYLTLFFFRGGEGCGGGQGALNVPVQEATVLNSGSPSETSPVCGHSSGVGQLEGGVEEQQRLDRPQYFCQRLNIRQSSWKQPRKSTGKQNSIDKKVCSMTIHSLTVQPTQGPESVPLYQSNSGSSLWGFLDRRE